MQNKKANKPAEPEKEGTLRRLNRVHIDGLGELRFRTLCFDDDMVECIENMTPRNILRMVKIGLEYEHGEEQTRSFLRRGLIPVTNETEEEKERFAKIMTALGVPTEFIGEE